MTLLRALLTSCLPTLPTLTLNKRDMSSILALAARFLALSVRFFRIICSRKNFISSEGLFDWDPFRLTLLSVIGGKTIVFSMVCMTIFQSSLRRRLSTAFSHDSAYNDKEPVKFRHFIIILPAGWCKRSSYRRVGPWVAWERHLLHSRQHSSGLLPWCEREVHQLLLRSLLSSVRD